MLGLTVEEVRNEPSWKNTTLLFDGMYKKEFCFGRWYKAEDNISFPSNRMLTVPEATDISRKRQDGTHQSSTNEDRCSKRIY